MPEASRRTPGRGVLFVLATLAGYATFFGGMAFLLCMFSPVFVVLSPFPRARIRILRRMFTSFLAFFSRTLLPLLGVYRISEISGAERAASPAIFVANHRSRLDGPILLGLLSNPGVIMKAEYARMPVFSFFVRHLDFISVSQHDFPALSRALDRCRVILDSGRSVLVFPEGTRSPSRRLQPFKDLAFRLAQDRHVPIVPVIVHMDYPFMSRIPGTAIPAAPMRLTVRFLDATHAHDDERPADFAQRVYRVMTRELQLLDRGTAWDR